ncbi:MAG: glucose-6-phosphate isomerase [Thermoproteota archaeon]|nr:MAG: glucose-6-phosphate isomerase [Candidatus Korarchaeota archaeon]
MEIIPGLRYRESDNKILANGEELSASIRRFSELKMVLKKPNELKSDGIAYYMFRDLPPLRESWARFDITVIPPWKVGGEFAKTKGHYHNSPENMPPYPEIYQVHEGKAFYLLQKPSAKEHEILDFIVVEAEPGDVVVVPPGYGHVTVNPSETTLIMSNIVFREVRSFYGPFERLRGAAYYYTDEGFVPNRRYSHIPRIRFEKPIDRSEPLVLDFLNNEDNYSWLVKTNEACEKGFLGVYCGT